MSGPRPKGGSTRRDFLAHGVLAACAVPVLGAMGPFVHVRGRQEHDLVIRGGTVYDGLGGAARDIDVAIRDGRVSAMGARLAARGRDEIDAKGMVVSPGFVDIHSHGDGNLRDDPRAESVIRQGITTMVVGCDGSSRFTRRR